MDLDGIYAQCPCVGYKLMGCLTLCRYRRVAMLRVLEVCWFCCFVLADDRLTWFQLSSITKARPQYTREHNVDIRVVHIYSAHAEQHTPGAVT